MTKRDAEKKTREKWRVTVRYGFGSVKRRTFASAESGNEWARHVRTSGFRIDGKARYTHVPIHAIHGVTVERDDQA